MKKLIGIVSTIVFLFAFVPRGHCVTYYLRADGTAANKAVATGCGSAGIAMSLDTHNAETFSAGDYIDFCDDAGNYRGQLAPPSSGESGNPITYRSAPGDSAVILGSLDADHPDSWTDEGGDIFSSPAVYEHDVGMMYLDTDTVIQFGDKKATLTCPNTLVDNLDFCHSTTDNMVYFFDDSGDKPSTTYAGIEVCKSLTGTADHMIEVIGVDYVTISDIDVKYANTCGVQIYDATGITIDNVDITYGGGQKQAASDTRYGDGITVGWGAYDILIKNCDVSQMYDVCLAVDVLSGSDIEIDGVMYEDNTASYCGGGFAISMSPAGANTVSNITFRDNSLSNMGSGWSGVDNNEEGHGIELKNNAATTMSNINIHDNIIDTVAYRGIMAGGGPHKIYNNYIKDTADRGIWLCNLGGLEYFEGDFYYNILNGVGSIAMQINTSTKEVNLYNNVVYTGSNNRGMNVTGASNVTIKNNIVVTEAEYPLAVATDSITSTLDNNCYLNDGAHNLILFGGSVYSVAQISDYSSSEGQDVNSIAADPIFRDKANGIFNLRWPSPCINAGVDVGLTEDYEGKTIPIGGAFDIGAIETYRETWFRRLRNRLRLFL